MAKKFGIDVSKWQGDFDFSLAVKNENVEFAILKCGGSDSGRYKDATFDTNYTKCKSIGLPIGCYYYGKDTTVQEALTSAKHFVSLVKGKQFEYPLYYDVEGEMLKIDKTLLTSIVTTFCDYVEKQGYYVGIYSSESHFNSNMNDTALKRFDHWVANWSKEPKLSSGNPYGMWQFGGERNAVRSNKINGRVVDQDYAYKDYPTIIKNAGLNGYTKSTTTSTTTSTSTSTNATTTTSTTTTKTVSLGYTTYVVKKGDTLWGIASRLLGKGTRYKEIMTLNNLTSSVIIVGQTLKIPE